MTKGVLYVRVSSREQQEEGYSVDAQVEQGREYARRHGIELVKSWMIAESAKNEDREGFAEMIAYMRAHADTQAMVFEKADRMTRNYHDLVRIYDLIEKHNKSAHFFKEGFHIDRESKSSEKLRLDLQVVLARNYINNLAEEVTKGMTQKVKKGGFPAIAPTGYLNDVATRTVVLDPKRAPIIKKLFEHYLTGRYSLWDLTKLTEAEGLDHPLKRTPIQRSGIHHILINPFYYGLIRWKGLVVMGSHTPLISKFVFDRVQALLGGVKPQAKSKRFAFTGFAECGHCGAAITAESHKKAVSKGGTPRYYVYYRCSGWRTKGVVCDGSKITEPELVAQLGEPLKALTINKTTLAKITEALRESFKGEEEYHGDRVAGLKAEETRLQGWMSKAYIDRLEDILSADQYKEKTAAWQVRLAEVRESIHVHSSASNKYLDQGERILDLAQRAHSLYQQQANNHERRKLVDAIISKVVISNKTAILKLREPFQTLARLAYTANSGSACPEWYAREDLNL